jgi:thymidylate kinase
MIIVAEGPDGCGKSTLIKQLERDLELPVFYSGGPKSAEAMTKMLYELKVMAFSNKRYIVDRVPFISEIIYSKGLGRSPVLDPNLLVENWFFPLKLIYCKIDQEEALKNMSREHKAHKPVEHLLAVEQNHKRIFQLYDEVIDQAEKAGVNIFEYDWRNHSHFTQLKEWIYE